MLPRVLEPEVMDSAEEARDYDAMDHSTVNRVFVADFLAFWAGAVSSKRDNVLDVGTGTAQIPIELCQARTGFDVTAIDLAEHMLEVGGANLRKAGLAQRIRLERVDAKKLPYPSASFAAVISNSIIHHIPEPGAVVGEMIRVARPGGVIFVRDLLRPPDDATVKRLVATYAGDANAHQQQMFGDSLRAALTLAEVRALVAEHGQDPAAVQQTTDRHWTWKCRMTNAK
jgi:ubiquinone/menaquinone biosynthesis C-methylase UbiE